MFENDKISEMEKRYKLILPAKEKLILKLDELKKK